MDKGESTLPTDVTIRVLRSFEEAAPLKDAWDCFVVAQEAEVFLTYDWLRVWWQYYGKDRDLFILVFELRGVIQGILPLCGASFGVPPFQSRVLRSVGTDFTPVTLSLAIVPGMIGAITDALLRVLPDLGSWDLLLIGPIAGKCRLSWDFFEMLRGKASSKYHASMDLSGEQTYFALRGTWMEQVAGLSKQERKRTRGAYRKLEEANIRIESSLATEADFTVRFDEFACSHQARWTSTGHGGHFADWPGSLDFHRMAAAVQLAEGRLRLMTISLNGKPVCHKYGFKTGHCHYAFLEGQEPDPTELDLDVYRLAFGEQAQHAIAEGVRLIDSMRGRYEHKLHLGGAIEPIYGIFLVPNAIGSRLRASLLRIIATLVDVLYAKVWRYRLALFLHVKPRPFWDWWIRTNGLSYKIR